MKIHKEKDLWLSLQRRSKIPDDLVGTGIQSLATGIRGKRVFQVVAARSLQAIGWTTLCNIPDTQRVTSHLEITPDLHDVSRRHLVCASPHFGQGKVRTGHFLSCTWHT